MSFSSPPKGLGTQGLIPHQSRAIPLPSPFSRVDSFRISAPRSRNISLWVIDGSVILQSPTPPNAENYEIIGTIVKAI